MSDVKRWMPENKLARTLTDPNGMLVRQAVQNAHANIDLVRDKHLDALEDKLDALTETGVRAMQTRLPEDAAEVYRLAREIMTDAGMFGLKPISRAAHSLCELMSAGARHRHQWTGIAVHVEAIGMLRRGDEAFAGSDVATMLTGLETISRAGF